MNITERATGSMISAYLKCGGTLEGLMMTDAQYADHDRKAAEFSTMMIGSKEGCGCEQCEEMRQYYEGMLRAYMARS
jgi:hypothetical protein